MDGLTQSAWWSVRLVLDVWGKCMCTFCIFLHWLIQLGLVFCVQPVIIRNEIVHKKTQKLHYVQILSFFFFKLFLNVSVMLEWIHIFQTSILTELIVLFFLFLHTFLFLVHCDLFLLALISPQFLHCLHHKISPVQLGCRSSFWRHELPWFPGSPFKKRKNQSPSI